jgi:hypothetical protein
MRISQPVKRFGALALPAGCAAVLAWAGPRPGDLPPDRQELMRWLSSAPVDETIAVLAALAAQLCLLYLAVTGLLVGLARLPGVTGRLCDALADLITPALLRRALEAGLGLTVATASVGASTAPALAAVPGLRPTVTNGTTLLPATAKPTPRLPSLDRPASLPAQPTPPLSAPRPTPPPGTAPADAAVVVHRGDSLWRIAARSLGPQANEGQIAAAWPRWYALNREVIGPDPDLLLPGQRLLPPH